MIAGTYDDNAFAFFRAVEALQQCIDHLPQIMRVVPAERLSITDGIDLVDEKDRRRLGNGFGKSGPHRFQHVAEMTLGLPSCYRA